MNDDQLDDLLAREAQSYHLPPEPPRAAMWEAIERARAESSIVALPTARRRTWLRRAAGIAAILVLGIAIGRLSRSRGGEPAAAAVASQRTTPEGAETGAISAPPDPTAGPSAEDDAIPSTGVGSARRYASVGRPDERVAAGTRAGRPVPGGADRPRFGRDDRRRDASGRDMTSYRMAVLEHMTRTELLLTSFRAQSANATREQVDAQFAGLARELLQTTRLLLSTHDNDDPQLTRLLEDLELVLMQISQYVADGRRGDLEAINQSLDRRNVLPKLRSTIPAGASGT